MELSDFISKTFVAKSECFARKDTLEHRFEIGYIVANVVLVIVTLGIVVRIF